MLRLWSVVAAWMVLQAWSPRLGSGQAPRLAQLEPTVDAGPPVAEPANQTPDAGASPELEEQGADGGEGRALTEYEKQLLQELESLNQSQEQSNEELRQLQEQQAAQLEELEQMRVERLQADQRRVAAQQERARQVVALEEAVALLEVANEQIQEGTFDALSSLSRIDQLLAGVPGANAEQARALVQLSIDALNRRDFFSARSFTYWAIPLARSAAAEYQVVPEAQSPR